MKSFVLSLSILYLVAALVSADEPNFVRTKVLKVGKTSTGEDADLVVTNYSDGLGNGIEVKVRLDDSKDRVSCSFFDDVGRAKYSTKAFIDNTNPGYYLPGDFNTINGTRR